MSLPGNWIIRAYECPSAPEDQRWVAHLFGPSTDPRTRQVKSVMLPATEFGSGARVAIDRLTAFLEGQISKEAAKVERGRLLGARRGAA